MCDPTSAAGLLRNKNSGEGGVRHLERKNVVVINRRLNMPFSHGNVPQRPVLASKYLKAYDEGSTRLGNMQDESRIVKRWKSTSGSSNQSLLKRKTIPVRSPRGKQGTARVIRHSEVGGPVCFGNVLPKKTVGMGEMP